jgi:hypothetical protein
MGISESINFRIPSVRLAPAREFQLISSSTTHLTDLLLILAEWVSQTLVKFSSVKCSLLLDMTIQTGPMNNYQNLVDSLLHATLLCRFSDVLLACEYKTDSSVM